MPVTHSPNACACAPADTPCTPRASPLLWVACWDTFSGNSEKCQPGLARQLRAAAGRGRCSARWRDPQYGPGASGTSLAGKRLSEWQPHDESASPIIGELGGDLASVQFDDFSAD